MPFGRNTVHKFPATRYNGSKRKLLPFIWDSIKQFSFHTALDAFGGTGAVSYLLKSQNKQVHFNDHLQFNAVVGKALIQNNDQHISKQQLDTLLQVGTTGGFIWKTFKDIYYTDDENIWLDNILPNIAAIKDTFQQSIAHWALFQACLSKRPFNLFHRKNLYVRTAEVQRSFGNKATWDTPFPQHFVKFIDQCNKAVFDNKQQQQQQHIVTCLDVFDLQGSWDLVYLDPPYVAVNGSTVCYQQFYHFLEGMLNQDTWPQTIDYKSNHLRLEPSYNIWNDKRAITKGFETLFDHFRNSIVVLSYRSDGIPSIDTLQKQLKQFKTNVQVVGQSYQYALSKTSNEEVLIIGY